VRDGDDLHIDALLLDLLQEMLGEFLSDFTQS